MPAPEQPPMVDEGLRQTQEPSTGPGMELETTATTILASVKEQVYTFFSEVQYALWGWPLSVIALLKKNPSLFLKGVA